MRYLFVFLCVCALGIVGCGESAEPPPDDSPYASKDLWLCRPDIENDHCDTADLSVTEIRPDGTMVQSEVAPDPSAEVDCFYVYPTVNTSPEPGNTETLFPHPESVIGIVARQAAHYRGVCRVFAPLYHQMSLITYWEYPIGMWQDTKFFQTGYDDVVEAFEYYMRNHNEGRDFVLIGHSQGSHVLTKLLEEKLDEDEALREQLVSAVLTGPTNRVQVREGELAGGSFTNIPLCTSASQNGCVIAFDANPAGVPTVPDSSVANTPPKARACVNPASIEGGPGTLAGLTYPRGYEPTLPFPDAVDTEWVRYPNIYTSRCSGADEYHVLLIDLASEYTGEVPRTPQELQEALVEFRGSNQNLHYVEDYLTYTDLLRIVERQIASRGN